jgi:hypothetical protein
MARRRRNSRAPSRPTAGGRRSVARGDRPSAPSPYKPKKGTAKKRQRGGGVAARQWQTVLTILRRNEKWLKKLPNVHHIGMSTKYRKGNNTGRPSVTIFVTKKKEEKGDDRVPRRLSAKIRGAMCSVQTDVRELPGEPRLLNSHMRGGQRIIAADNETGTAGLVFSREGRNYCMTNAHVVSDPGVSVGARVTFPAPVGGGGRVVCRDRLEPNFVIQSDAALIELDDSVAIDRNMFYGSNGVIQGFVGSLPPGNSLPPGKICFYTALPLGGAVHRTFRCRVEAFVPGSAVVTVDGATLEYGRFYSFSVLDGAVAPIHGHSGSLIYTEEPNGLFAAALAFGGIERQEVWAFPARHCYNRMIDFLKKVTPP